jgi:hypothetical protein
LDILMFVLHQSLLFEKIRREEIKHPSPSRGVFF